MPYTARMDIPYPAKGDEEWFPTWESLIIALDGHHFAAFEDRNLFFTGGGTWSWDASSDTLTWDGVLRLNTPSTGMPQDLAAGSQTLVDGDMLVFDVSRGASAPVALTGASDAVLSPDDAVVALCIRSGDKLYFRNGVVLSSGGSYQVFDDGAVPLRPVDRRDVFIAVAGQTTFAMSSLPDADSIPMVFRQGVLQAEGAGDDYTISGSDVVFNAAVAAGDRVEVRYWT